MTMKINLSKIVDRLEVKILGDEDWLSPIYKTCGRGDGAKDAVITAQIMIQRETEEIFKVSGTISFVPHIQCSLCADWILRDISNEFTMRAYPASMEQQNDGQHELQASSITEGIPFGSDGLDLEILLNDQIQLQIPFQTVRKSKDGKSCLDCGQEISENAVYSENQPDAESPFKALSTIFKN
jgi:uncharacterized metal-binding protein YceD (DUF177 family)